MAKIADIIVAMKGLQFVTLVIVLSLMALPFYINAGSPVSLSSNDINIQTISAYDSPFDMDIFALSVSRDSSENERESFEHGKGFVFHLITKYSHITYIHPENTSLHYSITISRDTPPPRLFA